jgi:hypothetical protein
LHSLFYVSVVNAAAGTQSKWPLKLCTTPLAVAQLLQKGLQVEVYGHSLKGDALLGKANIKLEKAAAQPGDWVELVSDLTEKSGSGSAGKFKMKMRFNPGDQAYEEGGKGFGSPGAGDEALNDLKLSQRSLHDRVGHMEDSIKSELRKVRLGRAEIFYNCLFLFLKFLVLFMRFSSAHVTLGPGPGEGEHFTGIGAAE